MQRQQRAQEQRTGTMTNEAPIGVQEGARSKVERADSYSNEVEEFVDAKGS